jgi:hypothetical protein
MGASEIAKALKIGRASVYNLSDVTITNAKTSGPLTAPFSIHRAEGLAAFGRLINITDTNTNESALRGFVEASKEFKKDPRILAAIPDVVETGGRERKGRFRAKGRRSRRCASGCRHPGVRLRPGPAGLSLSRAHPIATCPGTAGANILPA